MLAQLEVAHDLGVQQAHDVGEHREGKARNHFLRHRGSAQDVAALEHQRAQPGLRQVGAAGQSVVAATDDDHIVHLCHGRRTRLLQPPTCGRLHRAAPVFKAQWPKAFGLARLLRTA